MRRILCFLAPLVGWIFEHMSFAIPVKCLRETDNLMAFRHPRPAYPFHVLLVPKQAVASFLDLEPDSAFLTDLTAAVQSLVEEYQLPA